jgi:hypothetical protein
MTKRLNGGEEVAETTVKKTSVLRVSTHWYVSELVEDMSRNKSSSPGPNITCFTFYISICDLFTDAPSYFTDSTGFLTEQ